MKRFFFLITLLLLPSIVYGATATPTATAIFRNATTLQQLGSGPDDTLLYKGKQIVAGSGGGSVTTQNLTFAAGDNMVVTGDDTAKTVTFAVYSSPTFHDVVSRGPWVDPRAFPAITLDGTHDDATGFRAMLTAIADAGSHTVNLFDKTLYLATSVVIPPGISIVNGTIKGSIEVAGSDQTNPTEYQNPTFENIRFTQDTLVNGSYAIKYFAAWHAGNLRGCRFENYDKAIWVPQATASNAGQQVVTRLTIEDNKFQNVNYFLYAEKPTTMPFGLADVHLTNNEGSALIDNFHLEGVDGAVIGLNTLFQTGYPGHSATKGYNIYIDYSDWVGISNNNLFESGLDGIYLGHSQNFTITGNRFAWPGERDLSAGIHIANGDPSGNEFCLGTITGNTIMFPSKYGIRVTENSSHISITGNTVRTPGGGTTYYYGNLLGNGNLNTGLSFYVSSSSTAKFIGVTGNTFTGLNRQGISLGNSATNQTSYHFGNISDDATATRAIHQQKVFIFTPNDGATSIDVAGVEQVNLNNSAPTTITEFINPEPNQELELVSFINDNNIISTSVGTLKFPKNAAIPNGGHMRFKYNGANSTWEEQWRSWADTAPAMVWSNKCDQPSTGLGICAASFTTNQPITITRFQGHNFTVGVGCSTWPVYGIWDATASTTLASLTTAASTTDYDSNPISVNVASGHQLQLKVLTAGVGCSTAPASTSFMMQYQPN